tara:strand:- start:506 stop:955 length:450 start_codon:yes stop_codon:yes gene_type:complete
MGIIQSTQEAFSAMDLSTIIQITVGIVVLITHAVGVFRFVQNGRDLDRKEHAQFRVGIENLIRNSNDLSRKEINRLDERINGVKDIYVRRPDLDKDLTRLYEIIERDRQDLKVWIEKLDQRLVEQQTTLNDTVTKHLANMVAEISKWRG